MQNTLDRRLAAWLLTLPGPWFVSSRAEAVRKARQMFDASLTDRAFEDALSRAGYVVEYDGARFAIAPHVDAAAAHRDAA